MPRRGVASARVAQRAVLRTCDTATKIPHSADSSCRNAQAIETQCGTFGFLIA